MKPIQIFTFLAAVLFSSVSFAQDAPAENPAPAESSRVRNVRLGVGPQLGVFDGEFVVGTNLHALFQIFPGGFLGAQSGILLDTSATELVGDTKISAWYLPLQAVFNYYFDTEGNIKPYIGTAIGMALSVVSTTIDGDSDSESDVFFNGYAKFGIDVSINELISIYGEPNVGLISDQFAFLFAVGVDFKL